MIVEDDRAAVIILPVFVRGVCGRQDGAGKPCDGLRFWKSITSRNRHTRGGGCRRLCLDSTFRGNDTAELILYRPNASHGFI